MDIQQVYLHGAGHCWRFALLLSSSPCGNEILASYIRLRKTRVFKRYWASTLNWQEDNEEEASPDDDHDNEEKVETSIDEPEVQVLPEAEPDEVLPDESIELEAPLVVAE